MSRRSVGVLSGGSEPAFLERAVLRLLLWAKKQRSLGGFAWGKAGLSCVKPGNDRRLHGAAAGRG